MILKLVCFAAGPVLGAVFCAHNVPETAWRKAEPSAAPAVLETARVEQPDAATLQSKLSPTAGAADREFLAVLDERAEQPIPRAVAVLPAEREDRQFLAEREAVEADAPEMPVRRAVFVRLPETAVTTPTVIFNATPEPNLRRTADLRSSLQESALTGMEPEVRRAQPVAGQRASIVISGREVVVSPAWNRR